MSGLKIALTCWGSNGDVYPFLALARELKALGHRPTVIGPASYGATAARADVEWLDGPMDFDPTDQTLRSPLAMVRKLAVGAEATYAHLRRVAMDADVVVSHPMTYGTGVFAEVYGKPWASTSLFPMAFVSDHDRPYIVGGRRLPYPAHWAVKKAIRAATRRACEPIDCLRRSRALPTVGHPMYEGGWSPHLHLAMFSTSMGTPQPDWPRSARQTGFAFWEDPAQPPGELDVFLENGEDPVVLTLGSQHNAFAAGRAFFVAGIFAARSLGRRTVALSGGLPLGDLNASDVCVVPSAPHGPLFWRAAAVVHHGGIGTCAQALRSGAPQVVVPRGVDQYDNAGRLARLGAAKPVYAVSRLAPALAAVLRGECSNHRAVETVAMEYGAAGAAHLIDNLGTTHSTRFRYAAKEYDGHRQTAS